MFSTCTNFHIVKTVLQPTAVNLTKFTRTEVKNHVHVSDVLSDYKDNAKVILEYPEKLTKFDRVKIDGKNMAIFRVPNISDLVRSFRLVGYTRGQVDNISVIIGKNRFIGPVREISGQFNLNMDTYYPIVCVPYSQMYILVELDPTVLPETRLPLCLEYYCGVLTREIKTQLCELVKDTRVEIKPYRSILYKGADITLDKLDRSNTASEILASVNTGLIEYELFGHESAGNGSRSYGFNLSDKFQHQGYFCQVKLEAKNKINLVALTANGILLARWEPGTTTFCLPTGLLPTLDYAHYDVSCDVENGGTVSLSYFFRYFRDEKAKETMPSKFYLEELGAVVQNQCIGIPLQDEFPPTKIPERNVRNRVLGGCVE